MFRKVYHIQPPTANEYVNSVDWCSGYVSHAFDSFTSDCVEETTKCSLFLHSFKSPAMFLKTNTLVYVPRRFIQALFVGHRNAKGNLRALWPIFNYKKRLENRTELEENIQRRQLTNQINVSDLLDKWQLYKNCESNKEKIEKRRAQLTKLIGKLTNANSLSDEDQCRFQALKQEARDLRKDYDSACNSFYDIQERFNIDFLMLPNKLLPRTPDEQEILFEFGSKPPDNPNQHHLNYDHLIKFFSETSYFLQHEAAMFDLNFPLACVDFLRQNGFEQFSNADFAKTIVVEGGGVSLTDLYEVVHDFHENYSNLVHLVGNGSWLSFIGYMAKTKVNKTLLPLEHVCSGKIYRRPIQKELGLFDASQSTAVQIFSAATEQQVNQRFEVTLGLITQIYTTLNMHFRIVNVPAHQLQSAECAAAHIEMYSPSLKEYVEIGNLSHFSDYISYRLRFQCEKDETNSQYKPHIFGGTVCNVTKLLAIILESNNGIIPDTILKCKLVKK